MEAGLQCEPEQRMPRGMEFDFVQSMTITVQRAQLRREPVGVVAKLNRLGLAQGRTQRRQFAFRPARAFSPDCIAKHDVGCKQVVRLERGWLVLDLEHGLPRHSGEVRTPVSEPGIQKRAQPVYPDSPPSPTGRPG